MRQATCRRLQLRDAEPVYQSINSFEEYHTIYARKMKMNIGYDAEGATLGYKLTCRLVLCVSCRPCRSLSQHQFNGMSMRQTFSMLLRYRTAPFRLKRQAISQSTGNHPNNAIHWPRRPKPLKHN